MGSPPIFLLSREVNQCAVVLMCGAIEICKHFYVAVAVNGTSCKCAQINATVHSTNQSQVGRTFPRWD